jgi:RNA polymerase sigma-70 factor (ECF subfamily)
VAIRNSLFPQTSDEKLVMATLLGDMSAFDELVRRFRGAVILVAQQALGSREAAEDVAQEAFLLAFKALPQLQDLSKFAGWLCSIARHRARRIAAREGRSESMEPSRIDHLLLTHSQELTSHPAEAFLRKSAQADIPTALAQLPAEHRIVLQLRYYEEWSVARIAAFLSLPITTVKWRLHQGRERMRRQLTKTQETNHERHESKSGGDTSDPSPSQTDSASCRARKPYGKPVSGSARSHPALQLHRAAP